VALTRTLLKGEILEHENLDGFSVQEISQDFFEQKLAHLSADL